MKDLITKLTYSVTTITLIVGLLTSSFAGIANFDEAWLSTTEDDSSSPETVENKRSYGKMAVLFEQNIGQTDAAVKYISRGAGYTLYLTDEGAQFSLQSKVGSSSSDETGSKADRQKAETRSDKLSMSFANANPAPPVAGDEAAITKTNYYIGKRRIEHVANFKRVNYKNIYDGIDAMFYGNANNQLEYDFVVAPNIDPAQIGLNFDGANSIEIDSNGDLVIKTENSELIQKAPYAYQDIDGERQTVDVRYKLTDHQISFELGEYDGSRPLVIDPVLNYLTYLGGTRFDDTFEVAADLQGNSYVSGETSSLNFHGEIRNENDSSAAYVAKINSTGTDLVYVTILEGRSTDFATGITLDANNNVFVVGQGTRDFPVTSGAYDTNLGGQGDGFAAKLNTNGALVYATYIGGGAGFDVAFDVEVDSAGKAYIAGETDSGTGFPQKNRYQICGVGLASNSADAYLTVLNSSGSDITYSTCIGGNIVTDGARSIALDSANNAYLTGFTTSGSFPVKNAFQPNSGGGDDAWVAKFNPTATGDASLIYSTYLGGVGTDSGLGIDVNSSNQAVVVGLTGSVNFPLLNPFDTTNQINEGFVTVLSSTGTTLAGSSFLGGADKDQAVNVATGPNGLIYVVGTTLSSDFPVSQPFQPTRRGLRDAFVTKLRFGTGIITSSFLGGTGDDRGDGIAVRGNFIYAVGSTESSNLATTSGVIKQNSAPNSTNPDGFAAKILDTHLDSVGVFRPSTTFVLTQSTSNVVPVNATLTGGLAGARGVSGDWNGDSIDTIGSFTDGVWRVRDINFPTIAVFTRTFNFGLAGDLPVVGDWDGDGVDTAGTFRPSTGQFFLTNTANAAAVNVTISFGTAGDLPIAGDFDGDGIDTVGVFRPSLGQWFLTNDTTVASPPIDIVAFIGINGDLPFAGDFNGNGVDTIGVWRPNTTEFFLTDDNVNIRTPFLFGNNFTDQPIIGDWDGRPLP